MKRDCFMASTKSISWMKVGTLLQAMNLQCSQTQFALLSRDPRTTRSKLSGFFCSDPVQIFSVVRVRRTLSVRSAGFEPIGFGP